MDRDKVLEELGRIAFCEASDESGAKVKMASKLKALELLGKCVGAFDRAGAGEDQVVIVDDIRRESEE